MIDPKKADLYAAIGVALACMNKHPDDALVMGAANVLVQFIRDEEARHNNSQRDPLEEDAR